MNVLGRLADRYAADPWPTPAAMAEALTASLPAENRWAPAVHLTALDEALTATVDGADGRLVVAMPPRHGKSELVARWTVLWALTRWPHKRVVIASHSAVLAVDHSRRVRDLVTEHGSRLGLAVSRSTSSAERWRLDGADGGVVAVGVGSSLTGRGADLLIVDDPVAGAEDADSTLQRDRLWQWWSAVALTRLEPGASVVLVQTRWHPGDLAGRVLAEDRDVGRWRSLVLPALAEADDPLGRAVGDPLWPQRFPLEVLEDRRRAVGPRAWHALYQQAPTPLEGVLFHRDAIDANRVGLDEVPELVSVIEAVDPSFSDAESADETGRVVLGKDADGFAYVLADLSERAPFDRMPIGDSQPVYGTTKIICEQNLLGRRVMAALSGIVPDGVGVVPVVAKGSKALRAEAVSALVDNGRVRFAGRFPDLEDQLLSWRPGDSSPDRLDALCHGVRHLLLDGTDAPRFYFGDPSTDPHDVDGRPRMHDWGGLGVLPTDARMPVPDSLERSEIGATKASPWA